MPSVSNQKAIPPQRILVIDDLPLLPLAFTEIFRAIHPTVTVTYSENIFTALSAKAYAGLIIDLVITDIQQDYSLKSLHQTVSELKNKFGNPLIMIYSAIYDALIIEQMESLGIDAYVHKFESPEEVRNAYLQLSNGSAFVSGIFHTLYYDYGVRK